VAALSSVSGLWIKLHENEVVAKASGYILDRVVREARTRKLYLVSVSRMEDSNSAKREIRVLVY
jgi:hypothetical protein